MSTRSYICKENEDGTITGSYCHCDGYLTYNGAMLLDHYNTKERVDKLLSFGNMSCLNEIIEPDPVEAPHLRRPAAERHGLLRPRPGREGPGGPEGQTRGPRRPTSSWIEYCYVFGKDGKWRYFECGHLKDGLKDLKQGLDEEYKRLGFPRPEGYYGFFTQGDIAKDCVPSRCRPGDGLPEIRQGRAIRDCRLRR
jgi:hypothetical protein